MIQLTIKESLDSEKIGQFTFHKNLIYIGKDYGCDLYINDNQINFNHIFIEVVNSRLICHLGKSTDFILVNKKRTTGHKHISIGDSIKIGETLLIIDSFIETKSQTYRDSLNVQTESILNEDRDLLQILKEVQKSTSL
jgi:predicted component of type VI protein secretion system